MSSARAAVHSGPVRQRGNWVGVVDGVLEEVGQAAHAGQLSKRNVSSTWPTVPLNVIASLPLSTDETRKP